VASTTSSPGILVTTALYSITLVVMDRPNTPLLGLTTVYEKVYALSGASGVWPRIALLAGVSIVLAISLNWLLHTDLGLALRVVGANPHMAASLGIHTDNMRVFGLVLANGLVGLAPTLLKLITATLVVLTLGVLRSGVAVSFKMPEPLASVASPKPTGVCR
jgi:putative ABC transport system permease protein